MLAAATLMAVPAVMVAPGIAQASVQPATAKSGPTLCAGVSASSVSQVVGFKVPSPTPTTTNNVFDKQLDITEDSTECTYGLPTSLAAMSKVVTLSYETLSKAPPQDVAISEIKADFAKSITEMPKGSTATYTVSTSGGLVTIWAKFTAKNDGIDFTFEFLDSWKGTKVAGAFVETAMAKSKLQALEHLALSSFGV